MSNRERHRSPPADDDASSDGFPAWKTATVVGVVIACFAIIYPKMVHPVLKGAFSQNGAALNDQPSRSPRPMPSGRMPMVQQA